MIHMIKNKLLTTIFSLVIGFSVVTFTASVTAIPVIKNALHDYKKISCEITKKENDGNDVVLEYVITNNTSSDVSSLDITTEVYIGVSKAADFSTNFYDEILKKTSSTFSVKISQSLDVYEALSTHELSEISFKYFLNAVYFSDMTSKKELNYQIGSETSKKTEDNDMSSYSSEWSYNETSHWHYCTDPDYTDLKSNETSHTYNDVVTQPTYEFGGYTTHTCTVCGYSYIDSYTSQLTHNHSSSWSHDETYHWHTCTDSGYTSLKLDEATHTYNDVVTQPTYESGGYTTHTCTICGYSYVDNQTNQLTHNYSTSWSYNETSHWHACSDFGYTDLKSSENSHSFYDRAVTSINGSLRYTSHECSICGYVKYVDNIIFGEYPQSLVTDTSLVLSLNSLAITNSKGYFEYDGDCYAKLTATPHELDYSFDNGNIIEPGTVYYFKVEPIHWKCLNFNGSNAFLTSEYLLETRRYDDNSNNYKNSEIRNWLNNDFIFKAFNDDMGILTTVVDNSSESTLTGSNPNVCENTNDKIFLLSYAEVRNNEYGFANAWSTQDVARRSKTTDYARAQGAYCSYNDYCLNNGCYWTRSPFSDYTDFTYFINPPGEIDPGKEVYSTNVCVRPSLILDII